MVHKFDECIKSVSNVEAFSIPSLWIISYFGVKFSPELHFHLASLPKHATVITNQVSSSLLAPAPGQKNIKNSNPSFSMSYFRLWCWLSSTRKFVLVSESYPFSSCTSNQSQSRGNKIHFFLSSPVVFISVHFSLRIIVYFLSEMGAGQVEAWERENK